jgi:hypothetical protein
MSGIERNFTPTGMWQSTREKEIAAFEEGVRQGMLHWAGNHKNVVKENRKLRERIKDLEKQLKGADAPVVVRAKDFHDSSSRTSYKRSANRYFVDAGYSGC